ncbi:C2 calcium-dependent domain-containing protein 4C [Chanos chanos]|uniref:C2 calcium-dependent domain-containing protein 4C n=1 Tax=Chanos chanos TaxID=29144 RepID=A0A6J2VUS0_CHACN|nr:C2 calcium-dependent domain-containing protein 4C-like [Chanos chanos]
MWIIRKVQDSAENFPAEISRLVCKNAEEISAKTNLLNKLHCNVMTPDKIPDFFLPPRLTRRPLVAVEETASQYNSQGTHLNNIQKHMIDKDPKPSLSKSIHTDTLRLAATANRSKGKPLPFSLRCYESGLYESPNTRRKESLFHSAITSYTLERVTTRGPPLLRCKALWDAGSTDSDTLSSADSSPLGSPPITWPMRLKRFRQEASVSRAVSKETLEQVGPEDTPAQVNSTVGAKGVTPTPTGSVPKAEQPPGSTLAPPVQFPLDMLHCQERLHREHVLPLPHGGCVRLSAERHSSPSPSPSHSGSARNATTLRIRVVSVEGLRDRDDPRPLHCCMTVCLIPGKLQRQHSAIIRNCRNPVFNEDFFFTEKAEGEFGSLSLRLKVLDKATGLGRGSVLGVISKPLLQLLPM